MRKIYLQSKVGFELTPKGKVALQVLAKAETDRISRQLQEAIHQERKAKLRSGIVKKIKSIEAGWQSYQFPDKKVIGNIEQESEEFLEATKEVAKRQPKCQINPQNYDAEFLKFKSQIDDLTGKNNSLLKEVNNYAKIKGDQLSILADVESIQKTIKKFELMAEATVQVSQLKNSFCNLKLIQSQLESYDKEQLTRLEHLKIQLNDDCKLLDVLKKSTHEFTPIKREILAEKTSEHSDAEGLTIKDGHKKIGSPLVEKCSKCGAKRKLTTVDFG